MLFLDNATFFDAGLLTCEFAQVVKLGTTYLTVLVDSNGVDERRLDGEDTLNTDVFAHFANGETLLRAFAGDADNHTAVLLDTLFTPEGTMNMRNLKWADDFSPLQADGPALVDRVYSKAYVRHLFIANELLAMQIASIHNLAFYLWLVKEARRHIIAGDFKQWKTEMVEKLSRRL